MKDNKIRVVELFAGVGGFRVGLERASETFEVVWANQWEPGKVKQHAFDCYVHHFGHTASEHSNNDIASAYDKVPEHELLVGGFPCQDYSVARTKAQGIQGKKGVLWWEINKIIEKNRPKYILLENVDRLLKSPANQRGRDFAIMLKSLDDNGYNVEWMVINAADYGHVQRRRRVYIFGYKKEAFKRPGHEKFSLEDDHFYTRTFKIKLKHKEKTIDLNTFRDVLEVSEKYPSGKFGTIGSMVDGMVKMADHTAIYDGKKKTLGDVIKTEVDDRYYLDEQKITAIRVAKGRKNESRKTRDGFSYRYSEGEVPFPDPIDRAARTMLTSESSLNRSTHYIGDSRGIRTLTPEEAEQINGFKPGWTDTGMPEKFRYFCMGNALVVDIIEELGKIICKVDQEALELASV